MCNSTWGWTAKIRYTQKCVAVSVASSRDVMFTSERLSSCLYPSSRNRASPVSILIISFPPVPAWYGKDRRLWTSNGYRARLFARSACVDETNVYPILLRIRLTILVSALDSSYAALWWKQIRTTVLIRQRPARFSNLRSWILICIDSKQLERCNNIYQDVTYPQKEISCNIMQDKDKIAFPGITPRPKIIFNTRCEWMHLLIHSAAGHNWSVIGKNLVPGTLVSWRNCRKV